MHVHSSMTIVFLGSSASAEQLALRSSCRLSCCER